MTLNWKMPPSHATVNPSPADPELWQVVDGAGKRSSRGDGQLVKTSKDLVRGEYGSRNKSSDLCGGFVLSIPWLPGKANRRPHIIVGHGRVVIGTEQGDGACVLRAYFSVTRPYRFPALAEVGP